MHTYTNHRLFPYKLKPIYLYLSQCYNIFTLIFTTDILNIHPGNTLIITCDIERSLLFLLSNNLKRQCTD